LVALLTTARWLRALSRWPAQQRVLFDRAAMVAARRRLPQAATFAVDASG